MATVIVDSTYVFVVNRAQLTVRFGAHNQPCFGHAFYGRWVLRDPGRNAQWQNRVCIHRREPDESCPACFTLHRAHLAEIAVVTPLVIDCGRAPASGWWTDG